jgi:hypothetical protein
MILAASCGQLGKLMLRTDFKTENMGYWCLISSHFTWIVAPDFSNVTFTSCLRDGLFNHICPR